MKEARTSQNIVNAKFREDLFYALRCIEGSGGL
jgi:hypothetical protein